MEYNEFLESQKTRKGMLIVFSGPSGVGKDTLLHRLGELCVNLEKCVTYTTRTPRTTEIPGSDYNFVTPEEFNQMIEKDELLEYAHVHLDQYGTPAAPVERSRNKGIDVVLKIDVQGGLTVKEKIPEAVMIFIAPPSLEELERRLRSRYTDTETAITKRLQDAHDELDKMPQYDYFVVNDHISDAVDRLRCILLAERARIR